MEPTITRVKLACYTTNISMSVVSILYNFQLMKLAGQRGVAAYGAVMHISFVFVAVFLGYSLGAIPVVGFHYGAQNHRELKSLFRKSNTLVLTASALLCAAVFPLSGPLAALFVSGDPIALEMTIRAFRFYALSVLFSGFSIFGSAFFTALNNGLISAVISFFRTLICQIAAVMLLPLVLELDGIWLSIVVAELGALILTVICFAKYRKRYHYA